MCVIKRGKYRIYLHDLETQKARSITLSDDKRFKNIDELKKIIISFLETR